MICESSVPNGVGIGTRSCRRQVSLDRYVTDTRGIMRAPGDKSSLSDWMHLRGLGPIYLKMMMNMWITLG